MKIYLKENENKKVYYQPYSFKEDGKEKLYMIEDENEKVYYQSFSLKDTTKEMKKYEIENLSISVDEEPYAVIIFEDGKYFFYHGCDDESSARITAEVHSMLGFDSLIVGIKDYMKTDKSLELEEKFYGFNVIPLCGYVLTDGRYSFFTLKK